ncbi:phospholipase A2 activator protein [Rhynchophorus ferrugineus]|uniref:phospholipase A2 activator protein n=1 Tax=Rhynchophorus ferrugineus TaxID=354439 RepID=UPI003FCD5A2C
MSKKEYKLSKTLYGHSLDVRSVTVTSKNDIISGSRDKTAKFWKYNSLQDNYEEVMSYKDQKNFVGAVLYIEPTEEYPDGLVVTGGNDNVILVYKPSEPFATFTIKQHTNTVSCLSKGNENNSFLSGSWDNSAKYHNLTGRPTCLVTFSGHSAAIWSVIQLKDNKIVTASADKTIIIWSNNGDKFQTLTGHTDCVRALVDIPELSVFASAANDASIKIWKYTGDNIQTLYGHTNYIYSIANDKSVGPDCLISSDEDRTVRVWENGINTDTISLPAQSIWSVACLSNGDIVTGSSDGIIRVFTRDESRVANEQALTKFAEEVNNLKQQSMQEIGGVKVSDLPGKEALYDPGKKSGQMKMIREDGKVVAYTWVMNGDASHWEKVGDVMGGTDKDSSGKRVYEGKPYDFVFSVDVEDGKPPIKLPYNKGDDVYQAAHAFLTKNFLPAEYLEQVVDFILKNSKEQYVPPTNNEYQDPFTGGSRYTPSYQSNAGQMGMNVDPFTGGSSYSTNSTKPVVNNAPLSRGGNADPFTGASSYTTTSQMAAAATYFPISSYKTFDTGDPNVVLNKLKEFNGKAASSNQIGEAELASVIEICSGPPSNATVFDLVFKLLDWPDDLVFPVLDIIRLSVRHAINNKVIAEVNNGVIMTKLLYYIGEGHRVANNTILAFRILSNLCLHESGENIVFNNRFDLMENITSLGTLNKNGQIALATVLLNMTILSLRKLDELGCSVLAQVLPDVATKLTDPESQFRVYVALGTLMKQCNSHKAELVQKINENSNFLTTLQLHSLSGGNELEIKRTNCVKQLQALLF